MIKWIVLFILLIIAFFAGDRWSRSVTNAKVNAAKAEAELAHASVDSLKLIEAALKELQANKDAEADATIRDLEILIASAKPTIIYRNGRVDTIPGEPVTIFQISQAARKAVEACQAARDTCEDRVMVVTERADSSAAEAAHYKEAVVQLEKLIKGPLFRPSLEATTDFDWRPEAAFDVTAGRGYLKLLGRFVVREGAESCDFGADANTYACSTKWEGEGRVGVRYSF